MGIVINALRPDLLKNAMCQKAWQFFLSCTPLSEGKRTLVFLPHEFFSLHWQSSEAPTRVARPRKGSSVEASPTSSLIGDCFSYCHLYDRPAEDCGDSQESIAQPACEHTEASLFQEGRENNQLYGSTALVNNFFLSASYWVGFSGECHSN